LLLLVITKNKTIHIMRILLLCFLLAPLTLFSQDFNESVISQSVLEKIAEEPEAYQPILILLENQVNFSQLVENFDKNRTSVNERPKIVTQHLKDNAANTQKELLGFLQTQPEILPNSIRSFWIANLIYVKAKPAMIATLSNRRDIAWITFNSPLKIENATVETIAPPVEPNGIEPGLEVVGAPFMWNLGYTGYGQLAFCHDTGVDPRHPAFEDFFREMRQLGSNLIR
jgi:bacillopeptidase F